MSNLLDALKNAGLADEKKRKQAEREKRAQAHREVKAAKQQPPPPEAPVETEEQRLAQAAAAALARKRSLVEEGMVDDAGGRRRFYFETREARIAFALVSEIVASLLERGKAAIVEDPNDPAAHLIVKRDTALRLTELDKEAVRFLVKGGG